MGISSPDFRNQFKPMEILFHVNIGNQFKLMENFIQSRYLEPIKTRGNIQSIFEEPVKH